MNDSNSPLKQLVLIEKDASDYGFEWPNIDSIIQQVMSECDEIKDAISQDEPAARVQEEIGDLLHTAVSLCLYAGFDVEQTLLKVQHKFASRMAVLKELTAAHGLENLQGQPIDFMLRLWSEVKRREKSDIDVV